MKIVKKKNQLKIIIYHFYSGEKLLYVAWACFRNGLWIHVRGGSNAYPQSMFYSKNEKIIYTPVNPNFTI